MVEGQPEALRQIVLHGPHVGAELLDRDARLGGGKLGRGAVFVGGAEEQHLVPARAVVAGEKVGGQLGADEVAQMLDPVDVGDRRGDEYPGHARAFRQVTG